MLSLLLPLLLSFTGPLFGLALALIASEELKAGRPYLSWLKRIIFVIIIAVIAVQLAFPPQWLGMILFLSAGLVFFALELKKTSQNSLFREGFHYLLFVLAYFLISEKLLAASLIFLYGLPLGTLLRKI